MGTPLKHSEDVRNDPEPLDREVNLAVEVFARRVRNLAYDVARNAPIEAIIDAAAAPTNASLLEALATLVLQETRADSLLQATLLRGRIALARAVEEAGGLWSAEEAMRTCKVSRTTLQNWRDSGKILAIKRVDGSYAYPVAQFAQPVTDLDAPRPHPDIAEVITAAGDMNHEELVGLLVTPLDILGTDDAAKAESMGIAPGLRTGLQAIRDGHGAAVVHLIEDLARPVDEGAPPIETSAVRRVVPRSSTSAPKPSGSRRSIRQAEEVSE